MKSRTLAATAALATAGAIATGVAAAPGHNGRAAPKRITAQGVGQVKLGMTHRELRERGLVGRLRRGCELAEPGTRYAWLRRPLRGEVEYTPRTPRRVTAITILGGARARGVGIGATIRQIRAAFPKARVNRATEEGFGVTLVRIPRTGGGPIRFAVDVHTRRTTSIGVPRIPFCE